MVNGVYKPTNITGGHHPVVRQKQENMEKWMELDSILQL